MSLLISKVALRDAATRPSKRLSSWEFHELAEENRTLKAELARQRALPKKKQQDLAYERQCHSGAVSVSEGTIFKKLRSMERAV
jgi:hypothetical protein